MRDLLSASKNGFSLKNDKNIRYLAEKRRNSELSKTERSRAKNVIGKTDSNRSKRKKIRFDVEIDSVL